MLRPPRARLLALTLVLAAGCTKTEDDPGADAPPAAMFAAFEDVTWSMAVVAGGHQLSVTDVSGATSCSAAEDLDLIPTGARHQVFVHIADDTGTSCPAGNYDISRDCPATFGGGASVSGNCAYYRAIDASGAVVGTTTAINGTITVSGSDVSCTVRPLIGFQGGTFASQITFSGNMAGQTLCTE